MHITTSRRLALPHAPQSTNPPNAFDPTTYNIWGHATAREWRQPSESPVFILLHGREVTASLNRMSCGLLLPSILAVAVHPVYTHLSRRAEHCRLFPRMLRSFEASFGVSPRTPCQLCCHVVLRGRRRRSAAATVTATAVVLTRESNYL